MGKTRRKYTREFKLSVIRELESGIAISDLARKHNIHPALPSRWKKEYYEDPTRSFSGNGNTYKLEARNAELERLVGQLYAEKEFLKKAIANLERIKEEETRLAKRRLDA
jgi:transposase-like protein